MEPLVRVVESGSGASGVASNDLADGPIVQFVLRIRAPFESLVGQSGQD